MLQVDAWDVAVSSCSSSVAVAMVPAQYQCPCWEAAALARVWRESAWVSFMGCCHLSGDGLLDMHVALLLSGLTRWHPLRAS
jgi:hypothetical protein